MFLSFIYRQVVNGNFISRNLWGFVRRFIIKIDNESFCTMNVHGKNLIIPLSHALPLYLQDFHFYDRLPGRLTKFIRNKLNSINCIDVGANVGDTLAAFISPIHNYGIGSDRFLAIEPSPKYRKYLDLNWGGDENIVILPFICSSSEGLTNACFNEKNGTGNISMGRKISGKENDFERKTIDSIIEEYGAGIEFNILKIDTDGHDFEVIAGAKKFIKKTMPFLYFEVDAFSNANFINDSFKTLDFLRETGYGKVFIYDNCGYLIGVFNLTDFETIKSLLLYNLVREFYYFDFLLMKNEYVSDFYKSDIAFFAKEINEVRLLELI